MHPFFPSLFRKSGAEHLFRREKKGAITVLCFHRITDDVNHVWRPVRVNFFVEIIKYCIKNYEVILPYRWTEKTRLPKLIITFDDGFHDFIEYALPVLSEYSVRAVHHVVISSVLNNRPNWTYRLNLIVEDHLKSKKKISITRQDFDYHAQVTLKNAPKIAIELFTLLKSQPLSETESVLSELQEECEGDLYFPRMMNVSDLKQCEEAGIEIGSHGWTHTLLNSSLDRSILHKELFSSKHELEKMLGHPVQCFAFPAGQYDEQLIKLSGEAGYDYLFLTEDRFFTIPENKDLPVVFPRIIPSTSNADLTILKMQGFHTPIKKS